MTVDDYDDGESASRGDDDTGGGGDDAKARKRKERLEQNRISARESRKRKKTMIEELQRTVITLSRENKDLNERNESLRRQLMEIGAKYPNVVPLQAIVSQAAQSASQENGAVTTTTTSTGTGQSSAQSPGGETSKDPSAPSNGGGNNWMGNSSDADSSNA